MLIGNFVCTPAEQIQGKMICGYENSLEHIASAWKRLYAEKKCQKARCTSAKLLILIVLRRGTAAVRFNLVRNELLQQGIRDGALFLVVFAVRDRKL